jgi:hypothetical protein
VAQLPGNCRRLRPRGHPSSFRQADSSCRPTGCAVEAWLVLGAVGCLDEETALVDFDVDCDADIILGYDCLQVHDFTESSPSSTRRTRFACAPSVAAPLAAACASTSRSQGRRARAARLLGSAGSGPVDVPGRPSRWYPPAGRPSFVAALAAAAHAAWTTDTLAGLSDAGTTLDDGTDLFICGVSFAVDGPAFVLQAEDDDPPTPQHSSL